MERPVNTQQVFVISDLHLGGATATRDRPDFQMCPPRARRRLARFVARITRAASESHPSPTSTELIINGDFVDFLAEEPFESFTASPRAAASKLDAIIRHCDDGASEDDQVFRALNRFLAAGHRLTVVIGNHDVELTLPAVREELVRHLTGGRPARLDLMLDGEACRRGAALIEHGNRYDGWNAVAHGALRALRARVSRGEPDFPFPPPAGSRLVAEVMNPLKSQYRFIDLLKPENEAVVPILCALHPEAVGEIRRIFSAWRARTPLESGAVPDRETYVGDDSDDNAPVPDAMTRIADRASTPEKAVADAALADLLGAHADEEVLVRSEALLRESELLLEALRDATDVVPEHHTRVGDGIRAWLRSTYSLLRMSGAGERERYQHLRNALASHRRTIGTTFDLTSEDPIYLQAARRLHGGDVRFVVFGHTHLPKCIPLENGGLYLNTGTWCPTIRLDEALYDPETNSDEAVEALRLFVEDMGASRLQDWASLRTLVAALTIGPGGQTHAALRDVDDDGADSELSDCRS